jgi:hypothetical protein
MGSKSRRLLNQSTHSSVANSTASNEITFSQTGVVLDDSFYGPSERNGGGGGLRVSCCGQSSRLILLPILEGFEIVSRSLGCQRSCKDRHVAGAVAVEVFDVSPGSFAILGEIDLDLVGVEGLNSSDARPLGRTKGGRRLPRSFVVS